MNHTRTIKCRDKRIHYEFKGNSKRQELPQIDNAVRGAYGMALECIQKLKQGSEETAECFGMIFGEVSKRNLSAVVSSLNSIKTKIEKGITVFRDAVFIGSDGTKKGDTLSSAYAEKDGVFSI